MKHVSSKSIYSGPPLIRPPLGNGQSGRMRGWLLVRGILNAIILIHNVFSKMVAS